MITKDKIKSLMVVVIFLLGFGGLISATTRTFETPITYQYGGTGTSTALATGYLWQGVGDGTLSQIATSSLAAGGGVTSLNTLTGALILASTTNQLTVTASGTDYIVLSTPQDIHTGASPTFAGLTLSGVTSGIMSVDASGNVSTTTIVTTDISDLATNYLATSTIGSTVQGYDADNATSGTFTAGDHLTLTGTDFDVDAELKTKIASFSIINATTTQNPAAQHMFPYPITITRISCSSATGTVTIQFDERAAATPNTAGTDVMNSVLVCDTNSEATTTFANAGIAADVPFSLDIDAVSVADANCRIHVDYTINE